MWRQGFSVFINRDIVFIFFNKKFYNMFYQSSTLTDIMPDVLVHESYTGLGKVVDNPSKYFTRNNAKLGRMVEQKKVLVVEITETVTETVQVQEVQEGTRGVLPIMVLLQTNVDYCYRYGSVQLSGLDNFTCI